ncbi:MAG: glutamine-hydrolyzing GMP synthase [Chloroflexi bacterium]|nr:glutamine-hydrolyzing GMP synthase [Chloroflexota bacterium]
MGKPEQHREAIVVIDYGSQYAQLIVRRVREQHVYCEMLPWDAPAEALDHFELKGIILSGGPNSVYDRDAPTLPSHLLARGVPILGICYGMQLLAYHLGGKVAAARSREYGAAQITLDRPESPLFKGLSLTLDVWMSHGDRIEALPPGFIVLAHSEGSPIAAMANESRRWYGLQFHPEVVHTPQGREILRHFCLDICGCQETWTPGSFIEEAVTAIREQVNNGRVICAISGGVDSTVVAALVRRAIGDQLTAIFVNNGLLRKHEAEENMERFRRYLGGDIRYVDASEEFLEALKGVTDPERKRVIIGTKFIEIFEAEARRLGRVDYLAQGTLYPDVIESATPATKSAARIKTHHNVGGLPEDLRFELIEPLRFLFKDEVRAVGLALGLPEEMVYRAPFPGPGLAVRIIGEVTPERVAVLQEADAIVRQEIAVAGLDREIWQYFAVLTPLRSVGVMGDSRTYGHVVAVRAVTSEDGMTADWARIPYEVLARISNRIVNEIPSVNRVVYDISSKPPATIEWE